MKILFITCFWGIFLLLFRRRLPFAFVCVGGAEISYRKFNFRWINAFIWWKWEILSSIVLFSFISLAVYFFLCCKRPLSLFLHLDWKLHQEPRMTKRETGDEERCYVCSTRRMMCRQRRGAKIQHILQFVCVRVCFVPLFCSLKLFLGFSPVHIINIGNV